MKKVKKDNFLLHNWKTILILVLALVILVIKAPTIVQATKVNSNVASAILGAIVGALTAGLFSVIYSNYRINREYKSLIIAFASELLLAFERCVMYYKQSLHLPATISYSALFDFIDASVLSKLASVTKDLAIVEAIMHLKAQYFQIGRHAEEAGKFKAQADRFSKDANELNRAAGHAQLTALAFFLGASLPKPDLKTYNIIVKKTALIIEAAKGVSSEKIVQEISSRFTKAQELKRELDKIRKLIEDRKNINALEINKRLDEL